MKKTIILLGIILMNMAMISCSADSVFGEVDLQTENVSANGGGGSGTGFTPIKPPPPPPPVVP